MLPDNRQWVAEGLYHGIEKYFRNSNSLTTDLAHLSERNRSGNTLARQSRVTLTTVAAGSEPRLCLMSGVFFALSTVPTARGTATGLESATDGYQRRVLRVEHRCR